VGVELVEPDLRQRRGTFHDSYVIAKDARHKGYAKWPRLLDCVKCIAQSDDPDYFQGPEAGEFCVVDVVTKEKAWFEMPYGATPEILTALITSHFASDAFRVGNKLWFV
jgi:hypothetical protein